MGAGMIRDIWCLEWNILFSEILRPKFTLHSSIRDPVLALGLIILTTNDKRRQPVQSAVATISNWVLSMFMYFHDWVSLLVTVVCCCIVGAGGMVDGRTC
jgi:type III secretory pathway component EscU